ncbi:hypothetical protein AAVH_15545 [Aphelenchoides avenae]|nr:hypothetical protein AAVH_15545 [Aphelenchus avenae]
MLNGCYKLAQNCEQADADNLAQILAGFELDLDEDDVSNVSNAEIDEDQLGEGNNKGESEFSDNSDL